MGVFLCCWLPFFIWYLCTSLCHLKCHTPPAIIATLFWIGYANSALNPLIYAFFNQEFREAFKRLLGCMIVNPRDQCKSVGNTYIYTTAEVDGDTGVGRKRLEKCSKERKGFVSVCCVKCLSMCCCCMRNRYEERKDISNKRCCV